MKRVSVATILTVLILVSALSATAQLPTPREDAIWARVASGPISLDGVLDETSWAMAESQYLEFEQDTGIPGSGWKAEAGTVNPTDITRATLKLLVYENQLYLGAVIEDASVGGSVEFNRFDGILMAIKDHLDPFAPKPPSEYFYSWWYAESEDPQPAGQDPAFIGRWAEWPPGTPRTPEQIAAWDAVTVVNGISNDDFELDAGYTVEMRFDLTAMGYDVTRPEGDVVEWNISIYDCDWFWPFNGTIFSSNRVWWQGPWGNDMWYSEVRVFARPDVTVASGPVPPFEAELVIPRYNVTPTIDGELTEEVWNDPRVYQFDLRYGDDPLRQTYPAVGPYRSGQYQPEVEGGLAFVLDPGEATVKLFVTGQTLYMGFDVNDLMVQHRLEVDRWDGFLVTINERQERGADNQLESRRVSFQVGEDGSALAQDYLTTLIAAGDAEVALVLKPGTVLDPPGGPLDTGYTAELAVDLTGLGYPPGLTDGTFFFGVTLSDGDSFLPASDSYGTRTWWYREYEGQCCPVWAVVSPTPLAVDQNASWPLNQGYGFATSFPNPSLNPLIRFRLPEANQVTLEVFDLRGNLVERRQLGRREGGQWETPLFLGQQLGSGVYLYRMQLQDPRTGAIRSTLTGKTMVLR